MIADPESRDERVLTGPSNLVKLGDISTLPSMGTFLLWLDTGLTPIAWMG